MHIAAGLNVNTIAIFTKPTRYYWFPYKRKEGLVALEEHGAKEIFPKDILKVAKELYPTRTLPVRRV